MENMVKCCRWYHPWSSSDFVHTHPPAIHGTFDPLVPFLSLVIDSSGSLHPSPQLDPWSGWVQVQTDFSRPLHGCTEGVIGLWGSDTQCEVRNLWNSTWVDEQQPVLNHPHGSSWLLNLLQLDTIRWLPGFTWLLVLALSTVGIFPSSVRSEAIKYDNIPLKSGGLTKAGMRLVRSSSPLHL